MGFEKNMDGGPVLNTLMTQLRGMLKGLQSEDAGEINLKLKVDKTDLDQARDELNRLQADKNPSSRSEFPDRNYVYHPDPSRTIPGTSIPIPEPVPAGADAGETWMEKMGRMGRRFKYSPKGGAGHYDSPDEYGESERPSLAETRWGQIERGGTIHGLKEVGRFHQKWGDLLGGDSRDREGKLLTAAAQPEGHALVEAAREIEEVGARIAHAMKTAKDAGEGTRAAREANIEIEKLTERLGSLAKTGKDAAEGLGGDVGKKAKAELEKSVAEAGSGNSLGASGPGRRVTPGELMGAIQNPVGTLQSMAMDPNSGYWKAVLGAGAGAGAPSLLSALGGGSAALGAGAIGAGVVGAAYFGGKMGYDYWKGKGDEQALDMGSRLEDARLSNAVGNGMDFRGNTYDGSRLFGNRDWGFNYSYARDWMKNAAGTGISSDGFHGGKALMMNEKGGYEDREINGETMFINTGHTAARYGAKMGVESGVPQSMLAAAMASGGVEKNSEKSISFLNRLVDLTEEGKAAGVSSSKTLETLASFQQRDESRKGYATEDSLKHNMGLVAMLNKTGDPALQRGQGVKAMDAFMGGQNETFKTMLMGHYLGTDGKLSGRGRDLAYEEFGKDRVLAAEKGGAAGWELAEELIGTNRGKAEGYKALKSEGRFDGASHAIMREITGLRGIGLFQGDSLRGALEKGNLDVKEHPGGRHEDRSGSGDGDQNRERVEAETGLAVKIQAEEIAKSAASFKAALDNLTSTLYGAQKNIEILAWGRRPLGTAYQGSADFERLMEKRALEERKAAIKNEGRGGGVVK